MYLQNKAGKTNQTGAYGEEIAVRFMENKGFLVLERNFTKKWGEIDIITLKGATIHFVEVKTVSHETKAELAQCKYAGIRPEENLTLEKYRKLARTIESWIAAEGYKGHYQLDLVAVHVVPHETYAQVEYFENIVVG